jgi:hypothetical protein
MDLARVRTEEQLALLQDQLMERCDEISEISFALLQFIEGERRHRHEKRLNELRLEMQVLWERYRKLTTDKVADLHF